MAAVLRPRLHSAARSGAESRNGHGFHGLRFARLLAGFAAPVATFLRPCGPGSVPAGRKELGRACGRYGGFR